MFTYDLLVTKLLWIPYSYNVITIMLLAFIFLYQAHIIYFNSHYEFFSAVFWTNSTTTPIQHTELQYTEGKKKKKVEKEQKFFICRIFPTHRLIFEQLLHSETIVLCCMHMKVGWKGFWKLHIYNSVCFLVHWSQVTAFTVSHFIVSSCGTAFPQNILK